MKKKHRPFENALKDAKRAEQHFYEGFVRNPDGTKSKVRRKKPYTKWDYPDAKKNQQ